MSQYVSAGSGIQPRVAAGVRSVTFTKAGAGVLNLTGGGGINGRGRAISARVASGVRIKERAVTGTAISARIASAPRQTKYTVTVVSERVASGTKRIIRAFDLPDTQAWYTHAVAARQITRGPLGGTPGSFLGDQFAATWDGMNTGENGHAGGSWERRMYEEGNFSIKFPNRQGPDGKLHRERFRAKTDPFFHIGDEWMEIYDRGDLVYVGASHDTRVSLQEVEVTGADGSWLLRKTREYWAGYWNHAPRDVWEHYLSLWKMLIADDFDDESRFSYGSGEQTTSDGRWVYLRVDPGPADSSVNLVPDGPTGGQLHVRSRIRASNTYAFPAGLAVGNTWRVECQFWRNQFGTKENPDDGQNAYVRVGLWDVNANDALMIIQLQESHTYLSHDGGHTLWRAPASETNGNDTFQVVLEGRDRWIYGFINQKFVGAIPLPEGTYSCVPFVALRPGAATFHQRARVENLSCRRTIPYLRPTSSQWGDYRLPGNPVPGGLKGTYFNDLTIKQLETTTEGSGPSPNHYALTIFSPYHKLHSNHTRQDDQIDFTAPTYKTSPPTWPAPGSVTTNNAPGSPPVPGIPVAGLGKWFSVRWTGSVYLPLASQDVSITVNTTDGFRLWVGKTKFNDCALDRWFSPGSGSTGSLRAHIGTESDGQHHDGWYPLLLEYGNRGDSTATIQMTWNGPGGGVIPSNYLSPMGIFDEQVRMDSHWEVISTLAETYGYQFTCEPRQFEDAEFPGVMVPRVRIGRNTEKIVDDVNSANYQVKSSGNSVADSLLSDGAGLGSDEVQQVLEAMDYANIMSTLFIQSEYESWGDMTWNPVLQQRANTLLALRSSPWEEVETQPHGAPEMLDSFPLTGQLAMFRWEPGDGVRIVLPVIGVEDSGPRQILGVTYPFVPEGRQGPTVNFKQRPRGIREFLRRVQRQYMARQRNYQKQVMATTGSLAAFGGSSLIDEFSRVPLPHDLANVLKAEVTVFEKPDATNWYLWINDLPTTHPPIQYPGKYDITGYISRWNNLPIMRVEFRSTPT